MKPSAWRDYLRAAFGITWGAGLVALLLGTRWPGTLAPGAPLALLAGCGPSLAGLLVVARHGGGDAVRALFARLRPRASSVWLYAAILVVYPTAALLAARVLGGAFAPLSALPSWSALGALVPAAMLPDTGPWGEELGWRGFALPWLMTRMRPVAAALVLGGVWFAWHIPTFFIASLPQHAIAWPVFAVQIVALSVIMTALHVKSGGDLLLAMVAHAVGNLTATVLGLPLTAVAAGATLLAIPAGLWLALRATRRPTN